MSSSCKNHKRNPRKIPYGSSKGVYWCRGCDKYLVPDEPNKKTERNKAKRQIKKEINNLE